MKAIQKIKSNLSKITNVLRQRPFLSLYSYLTSRRIFTLWRNRTYIQNLRNIRIAGLSSSFLLGLLALAIIIPLYNVSGTEDTEAATSYNEASITLTAVRSSATITADANTLGSSNTALISSNLTSSDTTQYAEYNVKTTNATGYTIGIATNTASTSTNLTSGSNTLSSLAYNTTTMNGISSSDYNNLNTTSYNNTWALYPGTVGNLTNSKFYPISNNTITMGTTTAANSTVTSSNTYKVGLAARITMNQASGTYTTTAGNFKVTAVGNPAAYTISYNANGGSGAPSTQSNTSYSQQSVTLSSTAPTKTGYDFLGWCTEQTSDQATESDGSTACTNAGGTYYAAGDTFYIDETTTNITTLYAIWYLKDITVTGVFGGSGVTGINFANQTYGDKSITTNNDTTTLKYGASYTITGSYSSGYEFSSWAATAGSLGSTTTASTTYSTTTAATLTLTGKSSIISLGYMQDLTIDSCKVATTSGYVATDKRDGKVYSVRYINDYCWMTQNLAYVGDTGSASGKMTIGDSNSNVANKSIDLYSLNSSDAGSFGAYSGHCDSTNGYNYACIYDSGSTTTGVWYNYYAATAGAITGSSNSTAATKDICPAGWHLPTGPNTTSGTDIHKLVGNTTSDWQNPTTGLTAFSAVAGGFYNGGSLRNTGRGYWWSATAINTTNRYSLVYDSSNGQFYGGSSYYRYYGVYVRCVMTPLPTMQDATPTSLAALMPNTGDTATLVDSRDGESYLIGHLADDKYWMLDNLRLGSTSTISLSSSNTNLPSGVTWTLPASGTVCFSSSSCTGTDGITNGTGYTVPAINTTSKDTVARTKYGSGSGKIGVYYNYCAASAGNICVSSNSSNGSADRDICPKGWRMPTGGSSGEYNTLYTNSAIGSDATNFRKALSTPLSGSFYDGSAQYQGSIGYFWSSTRPNNNSMYLLYVNSSNVTPTDNNNRRNGYSVRCVLK